MQCHKLKYNHTSNNDTKILYKQIDLNSKKKPPKLSI